MNEQVIFNQCETASISYVIHNDQTRSHDPDLCLPDVLHGEIEPDSEAWVAGVGSDEKVKLKITDVVNTAQVPCRQS